MELVSLITCLNVLNIVVASPYGYGVKSGAAAAAKADAGAFSGAYGGVGAVPLSIPSGGSLSGSYSKSASSSFAASSASSSSSSFIISGLNPVTYSHGLNGISGGNGGCVSGNCQTECPSGNCKTGCATNDCQSNENKEISNLSAPVLTGENAKAGAVAGSFLVFKNENNKGHPSCNGYNCQENSKDAKCKDAKCASALPIASGDINDIQVKGISTNVYADNLSGGDKANDYSNSLINAGASSYYDKPSTYLTAPKKDSLCTSSQCSSTIENVYDAKKPSSYNVPIHGSYINPPSVTNQPKETCSSGNCGNYPSSGSTYNQKTDLPEQNGCSLGNCGNNPYSGSTYSQNTRLPEPKIPSPHQSVDFPKTPSVSLNTPCTTPNCAQGQGFPQSSQPSYPTFAQPLPTHSLQTNTQAFTGANSLRPTTEKVPYKGGFGGPPGLLKPNDFGNLPSLTSKPSAVSLVVQSPTSCSYGNCESKPQDVYPNQINVPVPVGVSTGTYNPTPCFSGKCSNPVTSSISYNPSESSGTYVHTTGFGGPAGVLKPNDNSALPVLPTNNKSPVQKLPTSTPCLSGTCGPNLKPDNSPSTGSASSSYVPSTSGTSYPTSGPTQVFTEYKPSVSSGDPTCVSGNCNSNTLQFSSSNAQDGPKPNTPYGTFTTCPSGNCASFPPQSHTSHHPEICSTGECSKPVPHVPLSTLPLDNRASSSVPCSNGICGFPAGHSAPSKSDPQPNLYKPTSCASGNCATAQNSQYSHNNGAYAAAGAAASFKAVVYTGGFGGPPGVLKPYDDGKLQSVTKNSNSLYGIQSYGLPASSTNTGVPVTGSYGKSFNTDSAPVVPVGKALASAAAGSSSGAFISKLSPPGYTSTGSGGCNSGCGKQNEGPSFSALLEGAAAKSVATTGAASYGQAGSFASSSASAYSSAGALTKGGYGRR